MRMRQQRKRRPILGKSHLPYCWIFWPSSSSGGTLQWTWLLSLQIFIFCCAFLVKNEKQGNYSYFFEWQFKDVWQVGSTNENPISLCLNFWHQVTVYFILSYKIDLAFSKLYYKKKTFHLLCFDFKKSTSLLPLDYFSMLHVLLTEPSFIFSFLIITWENYSLFIVWRL